MSLNLTVLTSNTIPRAAVEWQPLSANPIIGKDVLELLSTSMYVNPLAIYREYIQNAADAIDDARRSRVLDDATVGCVDISLDPSSRTVKIRDNGIGLNRDSFAERLIAFGASKKRGSRARGFRGVGRLAGLGYCQELIFRSKTMEDDQVSELRWDCRELKKLLQTQEFSDDLETLVHEIVATRALKSVGFPKHFFEVELAGIIRHGNDVLIDGGSIEGYLSQVAPAPFAPGFRWREQIDSILSPRIGLGNLEIHIDGSPEPVYRPHRNAFEVRRGVVDSFRELEAVTIQNSDGDPAAIGWVLHHDYWGAIPSGSRISGLRLRTGNMQIGEPNLLDSLFPEARFNSWVVGEIHIIDTRVLPNGRRDHFEQNIHFRNIVSQLSPIARDLVRRCRVSSLKRNRMRRFEQELGAVTGRVAILRQGATTKTRRHELIEEIRERVPKLEKIASSGLLDPDVQRGYRIRLKRLDSQLLRTIKSNGSHRSLMRLHVKQRKIVQRMFDLIYANSGNEASARSLVDKILRWL